jgi:hypothetical protein
MGAFRLVEWLGLVSAARATCVVVRENAKCQEAKVGGEENRTAISHQWDTESPPMQTV